MEGNLICVAGKTAQSEFFGLGRFMGWVWQEGLFYPWIWGGYLWGRIYALKNEHGFHAYALLGHEAWERVR